MFLSVDIVILMPALIYNLYIMIMKLIKTGNISFSFNGGLFYYRFAYPFVIINMRCSWIFALVGIGMRLSKMKKLQIMKINRRKKRKTSCIRVLPGIIIDT